MSKHILFIQGGGDDGYTADKPMVESLTETLGKSYAVKYPRLTSDDSQPDYGWTKQIADNISAYRDEVIIVAHSFGASMLLKYISENKVSTNITGIFLLATPYWDGSEDWQKGFTLKKDFADHLPKNILLHFYHCKDDEEVPFAQFEKFKKQGKQATFHPQEKGGHQFDNDLSKIAGDIKLG